MSEINYSLNDEFIKQYNKKVNRRKRHLRILMITTVIFNLATLFLSFEWRQATAILSVSICVLALGYYIHAEV